MTTILSNDGANRAVVTETDDGIQVVYSRRVLNDSRAILARARDWRPAPEAYVWRTLRTTTMRLPFHAALDAAHAIVHAQE